MASLEAYRPQQVLQSRGNDQEIKGKQRELVLSHERVSFIKVRDHPDIAIAGDWVFKMVILNGQN